MSDATAIADEGLPIICDPDEMERVHSIAFTAAIQTGARGEELDQMTSGIFRVMIGQTNRAEMKARRQQPLRLIHSQSGPAR